MWQRAVRLTRRVTTHRSISSSLRCIFIRSTCFQTPATESLGSWKSLRLLLAWSKRKYMSAIGLTSSRQLALSLCLFLWVHLCIWKIACRCRACSVQYNWVDGNATESNNFTAVRSNLPMIDKMIKLNIFHAGSSWRLRVPAHVIHFRKLVQNRYLSLRPTSPNLQSCLDMRLVLQMWRMWRGDSPLVRWSGLNLVSNLV